MQQPHDGDSARKITGTKPGGGTDVGLSKLRSAELLNCQQRQGLPDTESHQVIVIASGMGTVAIEGRKFQLSAGRCYYALPGMSVVLEPYFNELHASLIAFDRWAWDSTGSGLVPQRGEIAQWGELAVPLPERILHLTQRLVDIADDRGGLAPYQRAYYFHEWLYEWMQANIYAENLASAASDADLQRIIRYVELHYADDLKRDELAQMAGFSPEYFSVRFKQASGKSLTDYVAALRIRHIQERLLFGKAKLSDIAREVGYKDEFYLSRKFKHEVGISPTDYMKAPKRILSLNPHLTMHLLALGITPIATTMFPWKFGPYQQQLAEAGCVCRDWSAGFSVEELEALRPELIIGIDNLDRGKLEDCRRMAPTLIIPWYVADWRGHLQMIAEVTRCNKQHRQWLEQFSRLAGEVRAGVARAGIASQTVTLVNVREHAAFIYRNRGMGSQAIYGELGMPAPEQVQTAVVDRAAIEVDLDQVLPLYEADHMIIAVEQTAGAKIKLEKLLHTAAWKQYAQERGRVHLADMRRWHGYDPISVSRQLVDAREMFLNYGAPVVNDGV